MDSVKALYELYEALGQLIETAEKTGQEATLKIVSQPGYPLLNSLKGIKIDKENLELTLGVSADAGYTTIQDTEDLDGF